MKRHDIIEPPEVDIGTAFHTCRNLVEQYVPNPTQSQMGLTAIAMLACGAMIATAIYQLDATLRRRDS